VADREALRPHATGAAAVLGGALLGLTVAFPATAALAASEPAPAATAAATPVADLPIDPPVEAAETPSTSTTSTSAPSTTSTSTTTTSTLPPGPPITSGLIPPLIDDGERAQVGQAATTSRERPRVRSRVATSSGPTLPLTGSSFSVLAAGLGALAIGGGAVWWGSRRSAPAEATDGGSPPATG
jgi:LPXTG-motif cell wall-anchored protein